MTTLSMVAETRRSTHVSDGDGRRRAAFEWRRMGMECAGHPPLTRADCSAHYAAWQAEFPTAANRFRPGGFGENLVFARFSERNVHIGDVVAVGPRERLEAAEDSGYGEDTEDVDGGVLLLQVSLPRQPCFKLNHRFGLRDFAPNTWRTSRTGWYYRVLRPGAVRAGDEARLVRRPQPAWPLRRVQEFLHRRPDELAMVRELAAIPEFGAECRDAFQGRLAKHEALLRKAVGAAGAATTSAAASAAWPLYRVVDKRRQTPRITSFVLEAVDADAAGLADDEAAGALEAGAHVKLRLDVEAGVGVDVEAATTLLRTYSIVDGDRRRFEIAVALDETASRGGARFLHRRVDVGSCLRVGAFAGGVPLKTSASHHVYVAGGVGITAFLAQIEALAAIHYSCALHYAVRSAADVPYAARLDRLAHHAGPGVVVRCYDASAGQRLDVAAVVAALPWNARISFCGPPRLMDAARIATRAAGLDPADVHYEAFAADMGGDPFDVAVVRRPTSDPLGSHTAPATATTTTLHVDHDETLLEVLQRAFGVDAVASSCEAGNCGTCKVVVRAGRVEHRGTALTDDDKVSGHCMLSCVSRGVGHIDIEI